MWWDWKLYNGSQTADQVSGSGNRPGGWGVMGFAKEVLTDRGRHTRAGGGSTRFERELGKGPGQAHQIAGAPSDDIRQDRAGFGKRSMKSS